VHTVVRDPIGVTLTGLPLSDVTDASVPQLRHLLAEHGVVILPGQNADDQTFLTFLCRFGRPMFTPGETPVEHFPDLNVISNVGRTTPPRSVFHVDTSYVTKPPAYTALRAVAIPQRGGQTLFTNQYRAYETLSEDVRKRLQGRLVRHVVTGVPESEAGAQTEAKHPIFRTHPISGRTSLYLSTPERCVAISGLDEDEGRETIAVLYAHSILDDNVFRHTWAPGDVVIWDNGVVLHRADHHEVSGDRVMHRGMVAA
jgi:taurine dioxygenase